jgi:O-antigen/teichoic acid export membrane protein
MKNIKQQILHGSIWMTVSRIINRSSSFVSALILTRYLAPSDYGLVVISMLIINFLNVMTNVGIEKSLIQKENISSMHIETGWTFEIARGIIISTTIYFMAPLFANYFEEPNAIPFIRAIGLTALIRGFSHFKLFTLQKNLYFSKLFSIEVIPAILSIMIGIISAITLQNAWALVYAQLTNVIVRFLLSYFYFPSLPKLRFNKDQFDEMFKFGKWVLFGGVLSYLIMNGDKYFIGKVYDIATLGLYSMAYNISFLFIDELKKSVGTVLFPVYSKMQNDKDTFKKTVLNVGAIIFSITAPSTIGIILIANDFSNYIIGSEWSSIQDILVVLAVAGFFRGILICNMGVFYAMGKPKLNVIQESVRVLVLLIFIWWFSQNYGLLGIGYTIIISNIASILLMVVFMNKELQINIKELFIGNAPTFFSIILMIICVVSLQYTLLPSVNRFILSIIIGGSVYIFSHIVFYRTGSNSPLALLELK